MAALREEDLDVAGLMAVGLPGPPEGPGPASPCVSSLADSLDLPVRSMGMSDDLEVALSEGSTMVRLGRSLFGDRARPCGDRAVRAGRSDPDRGRGDHRRRPWCGGPWEIHLLPEPRTTL